MRMEEMRELLEKEGFDVDYVYNSKEKKYKFTIRKDDKEASGYFVYPVYSSWKDRDLQQRSFVHELMDTYNNGRNTLNKERGIIMYKEKDMLINFVIEYAKRRGLNVEVSDLLDTANYIEFTFRRGRQNYTHYAGLLAIEDHVHRLAFEIIEAVEKKMMYGVDDRYDAYLYAQKMAVNSIYGVNGLIAKAREAEITNVIYNDPATIVMWSDGKKTIVKAVDEPYDPEKGLAMAISKRVLGNEGNYYNEFKKWLPEEYKKDKE